MRNFRVMLQDTMDSFLAWFSTATKQTIEAYCDLETADSPHTFAAHDGSLVSIIRIEGTTQLPGEDTFHHTHQRLTRNLESVMTQPGHTLQVVFHYDPTDASTAISNLLLPSQHTIKRLQLALDDLLNERIERLSEYCQQECMYIVLWTKTHHLNREESKQAEKDKLALIRTKKLTPFKTTQNIIAAIPLLRNTHDMFVQSVLEELRTSRMQARLLEVHDGSWEIRKLADPEFTDATWRASLPGDTIPRRAYRNQNSLCEISWPPLSRQLLPRDAENIDIRSVRLGDYIYSSLFVDLLPKEIQPFNTLLKQTIAADIPWRISFLAESNSLHQLRFKSLLATLLSFSSEENRLLSNANNLLHHISQHSDEAIVQLKIVVCTWAPTGQTQLLRRRAAALARALQSWGISSLSEISGDPFEGLVATLPAINSKSIATPTLLPCSAMVRLLPLTRPASPFSSGAQLFRTPDGKVWPFQPGSHLQVTWIDLIYARPGAGKSVLSNALNLAVCLRAGLDALPYLSILDIGPSSKGLISLLQESLPLDKKHQVAYYALKMEARYTINPFDTQLGMRYPTHQERSFLVNFLTLLATPLEAQSAYDGMADMTGLIIDELYKQYADYGQPNSYTPQLEPQIDILLKTLDISTDAQTTWWEITDLLFQNQYIREAELAQRYAMPLLSDVTHIARTATITDLYGKMTTRTGETLVDAFSRMISRAIREYPILSGITRFDIGSARVVALDLNAVTKSGGPVATQQTAVMYMLARYILTRNIYLNETLLENLPQSYLDYHRTRLHEIKESTKRIVFDEFHRTGKTQAVRDQIINDMREGRKWNIQIALISQSLDDFDPVMLEFATSTYILGAGSTQALERSAKVFGLSANAQTLLSTHVNGPQAGGTTFLAQFSTTQGSYTQLLTLTLGPIELWALNTSVEDVLLREKLYQAIGPTAARGLLAQAFPNGTARTILESRLLENHPTSAHADTETKTNVIEQLYKEVLQKKL